MNTRLILSSLIAIFAWTLGGPSEAHARYDSGSDDLPGTDGPSTILVVSVVVVTGFLIYKLATRGGDDDQEYDNSAKNPDVGGSSSDAFALLRAHNSTPRFAEENEFSLNPFIYTMKNRVGAGIHISF